MLEFLAATTGALIISPYHFFNFLLMILNVLYEIYPHE